MDSERVADEAHDKCFMSPPVLPDGDTRDEAIVRSERNVSDWMSYLPQDCVESMIRMGWDAST